MRLPPLKVRCIPMCSSPMAGIESVCEPCAGDVRRRPTLRSRAGHGRAGGELGDQGGRSGGPAAILDGIWRRTINISAVATAATADLYGVDKLVGQNRRQEPLARFRANRAAAAATAVGLRRRLRANGSREQHVWHGV